ncbi:ParB N-terminal domain-containing protein [Rubrobacter marinus]|uniref:ParB N-terminal domain-containing protein n=1 Tax=Rubrobacter marinus TaxID=2653852 RepID=UPI00140DBAF4|nr:ParB N-terminal domain-containing protein [Rubrobacter marinus]
MARSAIPALDALRIVELSCLILHEDHDPARLARVRDGIRDEAVQRNPVIAAPYGDRYLVLDGAHRVRALTELGLRLALVQIIALPESAESWGHLLPAEGLEDALRALPEVSTSTRRPEACLVEARFRDGRRLYARARGEGLVETVRGLKALGSIYPKGGVVRRIDPEADVDPGEGEALLLYRSFSPRELAEVVDRGEVLPAGITRFPVPERVLNVRYPLALLEDGETGARNAELRSFVGESLEKNRVRYYAEPVVLFE